MASWAMKLSSDSGRSRTRPRGALQLCPKTLTAFLVCLTYLISPNNAAIVITPHMVVTELGQTATVTCATDVSSGNPEYVWTLQRRADDLSAEQIVIPSGTSGTAGAPSAAANPAGNTANEADLADLFSRVANENGTLTIRNASLSDAGVLECREVTGVDNATEKAEFRVYEMPDYMVETVLVIGLSALLFLALIVFAVVVQVRERKDVTKRKEAGIKKRLNRC